MNGGAASLRRPRRLFACGQRRDPAPLPRAEHQLQDGATLTHPSLLSLPWAIVTDTRFSDKGWGRSSPKASLRYRELHTPPPPPPSRTPFLRWLQPGGGGGGLGCEEGGGGAARFPKQAPRRTRCWRCPLTGTPPTPFKSVLLLPVYGRGRKITSPHPKCTAARSAAPSAGGRQ